MDRAKITAARDALHKALNGSASAYISFKDLASNPLFAERLAAEHAFMEIQTESSSALTFEVRKERKALPTRAGQSGVYPDLSDPVPVGIEVYVADQQRLDAYFNNALEKPKENFLTEGRAGDLHASSDGLIRFKGKPVEMRGQLITLCRLFISKQGSLVLIDDIRDQVIASSKRDRTSNATIAKYVSQLHTTLKSLFGHEVIFNSKKDGWTLNSSGKT